MARRHQRGKRTIRPYRQLPVEVIRAPQFRALSGTAVKVLLYLLSQYTGSNNGNLQAGQTEAASAEIGVSSRAVKAAIKELKDTGFITVSRQGGKNRCSLYALTFFAVDDCGGILDIPATHTFTDDWKKPSENELASFAKTV
ncbi:Uncharacterised protein [Neisseria animaloris]|uniref:hypothetical protein n=1 Tax=Neisseria animaloris TaxID=326522 RepID=UPI000A1901DB|nr:hypothetical protein [Neisseria animaloris]OSI08820.1 hypothetical protein BWD08_01515 [Neisseria animaloris]VEH87212.1 Uncharacterised protein [Neisseria animaloris]